tara:strand:+ start:21216 stop:22601 length:1386 start_codon:yes stop_codon:yes gene_type:complete
MGNPLKLIRTGNVSVDIQEMSNNDMNYITHLVLRKVALESDLSTGALNVSGVGTTVGLFSDTAQIEAIGQREATGAFVTTTTTLSQNLQSVSETTVSPLELINKQPKPISSANLDSNIISYISSNLANTSTPSISQYYLSTSSPAFSGTWVQVATLENTFGGNSGASSETIGLWKKTNDSIPTTIRPLKLGANGTIQEMSDVEIETLTDRYRNRIIQTGIGKYSLSTTPPATGTWVQAGSTFIDTRQQVTANSYVGTFAGTYNRTYTGLFTGVFQNSFTRLYTGMYSKNYTRLYTGQYTGQFTGMYQGLVQNNYARNFSRVRNANFTRDYTGVARTQTFTRHVTYAFRRTVAFPYTRAYFNNFTKAYTAAYAGTYTGLFTGLYSRNYTGIYSKQFTGQFARSYSKAYTGQFARSYTGQFTGQYSKNFTRQYTGNYTGNYTSDTVSSSTQNISTIALWLRVA